VFNKRVHLLVKGILMLSKCTVQQYKNNKTDVGLIRHKDVKWVKVAYDRINNIVMNLPVP